jgi:hypothetical protein
MGWTGATLHANAFGLYGTGLTHTHLHNLATVSEIEALPDLRLYELWIEQKLWDGAVSVTMGAGAGQCLCSIDRQLRRLGKGARAWGIGWSSARALSSQRSSDRRFRVNGWLMASPPEARWCVRSTPRSASHGRCVRIIELKFHFLLL